MEENNVNDILGIEKSRSQENDENNSIESLQQDSSINKVLNVTLSGGIIGLLSDSPKNKLNRAIKKENFKGWRVVQIIPAASGNLFLMILRFLILVVTLFLYTPSNGFYVIMERINKE
jgi:hypothetical protein